MTEEGRERMRTIENNRGRFRAPKSKREKTSLAYNLLSGKGLFFSLGTPNQAFKLGTSSFP
jgi:hypothetical protein